MSRGSLKQRIEAGASDREFVELGGAIDGAFLVSRKLIALDMPSDSERAIVDLNEVIAQLEGVLTRVLGPETRVILQLGAVDAMVEADATQLDWVFLNLAANSREAMPDGGTFTIQTSSADRRVGTPSRMQRFVRVTVGDTGPGLFGDARTRAFDPFFGPKEDAAGLGLTSVAMVVRSFQGWLHIESDHSGTRIHIHIPTRAASRA